MSAQSISDGKSSEAENAGRLCRVREGRQEAAQQVKIYTNWCRAVVGNWVMACKWFELGACDARIFSLF